MLYNFFTKRNNRSYNLKLAKYFGVYSAVIISLLLEQKEEAILEGKTVDEYFILSRQMIYDFTGLEDDKQTMVEDNLIETGLIDIKPVKNSVERLYYHIDEDLLMKVLMSESGKDAEKLFEKPGTNKKLIKTERPKPISKRAQYIMNLKKNLQEKDPVIRGMLNDWIDTIYENPAGFLAPTTVAACLVSLEEYSGGKQKIKKEVMEIAIKSQHKNLDWSIENHSKQKKTESRKNFTNKDKTVDIDKNIEEILKGGVNGF